ALEAVVADEVPELDEAVLLPVRIDDEVARDLVVHGARDARRLQALVRRGVLREAGESGVGRRFEAEEDVDVLGDGTPFLEQLGMARDEIASALYEHPALPYSAAADLERELAAALGVVPEEVVDD